MSTGDDTLYLRSRIALRHGKTSAAPGGQWSSPPAFMKDGFQKWAESERPAREGGVEKIPSEYQSMKGKGLFDSAKEALKIASDMKAVYDQAKDYAPKIKGALRNKTVQSAIANGKYAGTMEDIAKYMEMVGLGHHVGDKAMEKRVKGSKSFKDWCKEEMNEESHGGRIGMSMPYHHDEEYGRSGKGGDSFGLDAYAKKVAKARGMGKKAVVIPDDMVRGAGLLDSGKKVYDWLKAHKSVIHGILDSPYMNEKNPAGATDVPKKVSGVLSKVGLGRKEEGGRIGMGKRAPSAYAQFVKSFAAENPGLGKSLMSEAAKAWKASK